MQYKITKKQQIKELLNRVPPVVNVNIVILKEWKYLVGKRASGAPDDISNVWLFPGKRMKFDESIYETAFRTLSEEVPGVKAQFKKLITASSDKGYDKRANGVTIYVLFNYLSGKPKTNSQLDEFRWVDKKEFNQLLGAHPAEISIFDQIDQTVRTMNTTEDEILVEVNKHNKEIGQIIKREAHSDSTRFHRAAWIFLFNSKGDVVLQQRGFNKTHNPGLWDMAGGHQIHGNTIEETAHRELIEEMGIDTKLKLKGIGLYQSEWQSEFHYLYYGVHDGPYKFDPNEVADIKIFDCQKLLDGKYDKKFFIMGHVSEQLKILKPIWTKLI